MRPPRAASALAGAVLLLTGCGGASGGAPAPTSSAVTPEATRSARFVSSDPIDAARLPAGRSPRVAYLGGGQVRWRGRTTTTDFPARALRPTILGRVGTRLVVTAYQPGGAEPGERFWTVDTAGHAELLPTRHQSYDYAPRLVQSTGHLWVHFSDRTSPRTIWEVDALTGRDVATFSRRPPRGLAPADQALVDAWVARRVAVPDTDAHTRDGAVLATTTSAVGGTGVAVDTVEVSRASDHAVLGRFRFARGQAGGVERVVLEGHRHVLVVSTVGLDARHGERQVVVRCSLVDQRCERATDVTGGIALGVVRPLFEPGDDPDGG